MESVHFTVQNKGDRIIGNDAPVTSAMQRVVEIETQRIRFRLNKKQLCKAAKIKQEMYSYLQRRARLGYELPEDCTNKIMNALKRMETQTP